MGSGAARTLSALVLLALGAGTAQAQDCTRPDFAAAQSAGTPAVLCVLRPDGPARLRVEIADDEAERNRGLMGRASLIPGTGMVFLYPSAREVAFWMHDTPLPLDLIFIDAGGRIARIHENARPFDETPIPSGSPVQAVLEIGGGQAAALGLAPGQVVRPLR